LATERVERRLTAILAADVAGYSRLTGTDEEGTHARLQDHLRSLVDPKIAQHRGRVVKNTGDGMLAEFSSVVDAVRCALDVQRGMAERNAELPRLRGCPPAPLAFAVVSKPEIFAAEFARSRVASIQCTPPPIILL
jgi:class 3 adenylate cyclase